MITIICIVLGIIIYLICGRIIINVLQEKELLYCDYDLDFDEAIKFLSSLFFPILLIWIFIRESGDKISDFL